MLWLLRYISHLYTAAFLSHTVSHRFQPHGYAFPRLPWVRVYTCSSRCVSCLAVALSLAALVLSHIPRELSAPFLLCTILESGPNLMATPSCVCTMVGPWVSAYTRSLCCVSHIATNLSPAALLSVYLLCSGSHGLNLLTCLLLESRYRLQLAFQICNTLYLWIPYSFTPEGTFDVFRQGMYICVSVVFICSSQWGHGDIKARP